MPAEEVNDGDEYPDGNDDDSNPTHILLILTTLQERSNPKKTTTLLDTPSLPPTNSKLHSGEISRIFSPSKYQWLKSQDL